MQRRLLIKFSSIFLILLSFFSFLTKCHAYTLPALNEITEKAASTLEKLKISSIFDVLSSGLISYTKLFSKSFCLCIVIIIIGIVFSAVKSSFAVGENIFELVSLCLITITVFGPISLCFDIVQEHLEAICAYMLSFIPAGVIMHSASGNTLSSALMASSYPASTAILQTVSISIILPMIKALFALQTVNALCKKTNLSSIANFIKSTSLWILGLSFTIFTGIMSLQTFLQGSADNLAMKGLKYGAAKLIPIAGGVVSESMKSVIASVGYIKNVTGIAGIVFIVYTVIPPICAMLITKLFLSILSAFADATGQNAVSSHLSAICSVLNILFALLTGCSLAFIMLLAMFMKTTVSL